MVSCVRRCWHGSVGTTRPRSRPTLAVRLIAATDYLDLHAHAMVALAEVRRLAGRAADAASSLRGAHGLYQRKGNVVELARTASLLDELEA